METLSAQDFKERILDFCEMENPPAIMIFGDPGVGKTFSTKEAAEEAGRVYIPLSLGRLEAYDIKGMPELVNGFMQWAPPINWDTVIQAKGNVIIHFDEFTLADESVQGAVLDIVQMKKVDDLKLPPNTMIVVSGNMGGEDGTFAKIISSALTGGRAFSYKIKPPAPKGWIAWQKPIKEIEGFISTMGLNALITGPAKDDPFSPWTCPRSWSLLDNTCKEMIAAKKLDLSTPQGMKKLQSLARGVLSMKTVQDFMDYVSDALIDAVGLLKGDDNAWKKYGQAKPLKRSFALEEVVTILFSDPTYKKESDRKKTAQDFLDRLVKTEKEADILSKSVTLIGDQDPFLYESLTINGKNVGKYFDDLLKARMKK